MENEIILGLLVNFFWFSLVIIGYAVIHYFANFSKTPKKLKKAINIVLGRHVFIIFFASFAVACFFASLFTTVGYIVHLPVKLLAILYLGALIMSGGYLLSRWLTKIHSLPLTNFLKLLRLDSLVKVITLILCVVVIVDFVVALQLRSYALLGVDAYYHMTRVMHMLTVGYISVDSGYFYNVTDSSYHANLILALYTIPSKIFHIEPITVWAHSFGFFRLIQWTAIFTLGYVTFGKLFRSKVSTIYASLATVLAVAFFAHHFFIATYPNNVANVWLIGLVIGLFTWVRDRTFVGIVIMVISSFLLTTTHPTYALMAAVFIVYWCTVYAIVQKCRHESVKEIPWKAMAVNIAILMVGPVTTKLMPSHITNGQINIGSPDLLQVWFMDMKSPFSSMPIASWQWVALGLSIVGFAYVLMRARQMKHVALLIFTLVSFSYVILYFPPVFSLLKTVLPVWVIERFATMNVYQFILPFAGVVAIAHSLYGAAIRLGVDETIRNVRIPVVVSCLAVGVFGLVIPLTYEAWTSMKKWNNQAYEYNGILFASIANVIPAGSRVLASEELSYVLPAIVPVNVIAVSMGHSTMAADTNNRIACSNKMMKTFDYGDFVATGTEYVVISGAIFGHDVSKTIQVLSARSHLSLVYSANNIWVYRFREQQPTEAANDSSPHRACIEYSGNEQR